MAAKNPAVEAGTVFGRWTATGLETRKPVGCKGTPVYFAEVMCSCGVKAEVPTASLRRGSSTQCRDCAKQSRSPVSFSPVEGARFGCLVLTGNQQLKPVGTLGKNRRSWEFRCDCGIVKWAPRIDIINKRTKSCGCDRGSPLPYGESAKRNMLWSYKNAAQENGVIFELTDEQFFALTTGPCYYCAALPTKERYGSTNRGNGGILANGVDRFINDKGYTLDNAVSCCTTCNLNKRHKSGDAYIEHCRRVADHHKAA
jgi:hypothetical protein